MHLRNAGLIEPNARVALYWAVQGELPLLDTVHLLTAIGAAQYLPVVQDDGSLRFAPWRTGAELASNRFGIPEPVVKADQLFTAADLDVILLPLLAFDGQGNRVGSGAGFYDRSLAALISGPRPGKPLLIGVGYAFQQVARLVAQPWDVRLDRIVCQSGLVTAAPVYSRAD